MGGATPLPTTQSLIAFREFQRNKFSVQDVPCSDRPSTSIQGGTN